MCVSEIVVCMFERATEHVERTVTKQLLLRLPIRSQLLLLIVMEVVVLRRPIVYAPDSDLNLLQVLYCLFSVLHNYRRPQEKSINSTSRMHPMLFSLHFSPPATFFPWWLLFSFCCCFCVFIIILHILWNIYVRIQNIVFSSTLNNFRIRLPEEKFVRRRMLLA